MGSRGFGERLAGEIVHGIPNNGIADNEAHMLKLLEQGNRRSDDIYNAISNSQSSAPTAEMMRQQSEHIASAMAPAIQDGMHSVSNAVSGLEHQMSGLEGTMSEQTDVQRSIDMGVRETNNHLWTVRLQGAEVIKNQQAGNATRERIEGHLSTRVSQADFAARQRYYGNQRLAEMSQSMREVSRGVGRMSVAAERFADGAEKMTASIDRNTEVGRKTVAAIYGNTEAVDRNTSAVRRNTRATRDVERAVHANTGAVMAQTGMDMFRTFVEIQSAKREGKLLRQGLQEHGLMLADEQRLTREVVVSSFHDEQELTRQILAQAIYDQVDMFGAEMEITREMFADLMERACSITVATLNQIGSKIDQVGRDIGMSIASVRQDIYMSAVLAHDDVERQLALDRERNEILECIQVAVEMPDSRKQFNYAWSYAKEALAADPPLEEDAMDYYKEAYSHYKLDPEFNGEFGLIKLSTGDAEGAEKLFFKAAAGAKDPTEKSRYQLLQGVAMIDQGKHVDAVRMMNGAEMADRSNAEVHFCKAVAYAGLEKFDSAIESINKALQMDDSLLEKILSYDEFTPLVSRFNAEVYVPLVMNSDSISTPTLYRIFQSLYSEGYPSEELHDKVSILWRRNIKQALLASPLSARVDPFLSSYIQLTGNEALVDASEECLNQDLSYQTPYEYYFMAGVFALGNKDRSPKIADLIAKGLFLDPRSDDPSRFDELVMDIVNLLGKGNEVKVLSSFIRKVSFQYRDFKNYLQYRIKQ